MDPRLLDYEAVLPTCTPCSVFLTRNGPAVVTVVPGLTSKYGSQNKQRIFLDTALNYRFFGVAYEEEEKALCADTVRPAGPHLVSAANPFVGTAFPYKIVQHV